MTSRKRLVASPQNDRITRFSYANVMSTLAFFFAVGGTSLAAANIGSNQVVDNSIQSRDIRNGAVASVDLHQGVRSSLRRGLLAYSGTSFLSDQPVTYIGPKQVAVSTDLCRTGKALGGGFDSQIQLGLQIASSHPTDDGRGWTVEAYNPTATALPIRAWAVCTY